MNYEQRARLDALLGRKRRPAICYNPKFTPHSMPRERWRWIEHASCGLRVRTSADVWKEHGTRSRDAGCGWYVDSFQSETTRGVVLQIPGRDRMPRYVPACSDPWNSDAYLADFRNVHDDIMEAARDADGMAERYAELCREDDAEFMANQDIETATADLCEARKKARALLRTLREHVGMPELAVAALRTELERARDAAHDAIATIRARRITVGRAKP